MVGIPSRVSLCKEGTLVGKVSTIGQEVGVLVAEWFFGSCGEVVVLRQHLSLRMETDAI